MCTEWKNSSLTEKNRKALKFRCMLSLLHFAFHVNFKISVDDFGGKNKWSFENTSWCWSGSPRWKNFLRMRNSLFLLWHQSSKNYSEIDAILVNAMLCSDELYCSLDQSGVAIPGPTNALNTRQSEAVTVSLFFCPFHPHVINATTPTNGYLYSPQFRSHQEMEMASGRTQRSKKQKNRGLSTV